MHRSATRPPFYTARSTNARIHVPLTEKVRVAALFEGACWLLGDTARCTRSPFVVPYLSGRPPAPLLKCAMFPDLVTCHLAYVLETSRAVLPLRRSLCFVRWMGQVHCICSALPILGCLQVGSTGAHVASSHQQCSAVSGLRTAKSVTLIVSAAALCIVHQLPLKLDSAATTVLRCRRPGNGCWGRSGDLAPKPLPWLYPDLVAEWQPDQVQPPRECVVLALPARMAHEGTREACMTCRRLLFAQSLTHPETWTGDAL